MDNDALVLDELAGILRPPEWQLDALCREYPSTNFFPERGESVAFAKAVCSFCLVRLECLTYCFATGQHDGIWGGTSERERRGMRVADPTLRRARESRVRCGTAGGYQGHYDRGERPCDVCREGKRADDHRRYVARRSVA